jgi:hypothetical protein
MGMAARFAPAGTTGCALLAAAETAQRDDRLGPTTRKLQSRVQTLRVGERLHHACCDHWLVPFLAKLLKRQ